MLFSVFISCKSKKREVHNVRINDDSIPVQEFFDTTIMEMMRDNQIAWRLTTTHMVKYKKNENIFVNPVYVNGFNSKGKISSSLFADSGLVSGTGDTLIAIGHVLLKAADGKRMNTSKLSWDRNTDFITSNRYVRMKTESGDVFSGVGFEAKSDLNEWRILKNVKAEIHNVEKQLGSY